MLGRLLIENGASHPQGLALVDGERRFRHAELAALTAALASGPLCRLAGQRVGLAVRTTHDYLASAAALDLLGAHSFLVGPRPDEEIERMRAAFQWSAVLTDRDVRTRSEAGATSTVAAGDRAGRVSIFTSGTTGSPKAVNHSWDTLARPTRKSDRRNDAIWFCPYPLHLYAGIQVVLQALVNAAALVVPASLQPSEVARLLVDESVSHASGTPTFWRQVLFFGGRDLLRRCVLRQITLGGEAATQDLLERLRSAFPGARIVHIYASTELGRLFSVTDGREGFPAGYLRAIPGGGVELSIVDGELHARSRNSMIGYDGVEQSSERDTGWFATGDLVELREDRVLFRGRATDVINVGGHKVAPSKVEAVLRSVAGVADARVYPRASSLAGQLVAADVVLCPDTDESDVRESLQQTARQRLPRHELPRVLRFVPALRRSGAFKILRKESKR